jgi:hypothetical protein
MVVMGVDDSVTHATANLPSVHRKRSNCGHGEGKSEADPEENAVQRGRHGAGNDQHDRVVDYLHGGDGRSVRRQRVMSGREVGRDGLLPNESWSSIHEPLE